MWASLDDAPAACPGRPGRGGCRRPCAGTAWAGALPCGEGPTMDRSTTTSVPGTKEPAAAGFRHEALFYRGEEEFLRRATTFVRDGLAAGAPVLVVVDAPKVARLRAALGADSAAVAFAAM